MSVDGKKANKVLTVAITVLSIPGIISVWFWRADGLSVGPLCGDLVVGSCVFSWR